MDRVGRYGGVITKCEPSIASWKATVAKVKGMIGAGHQATFWLRIA